MDYANGTELAVWQWNVMANPAPLTWFDNEEDGFSHIIKIDEFIKWIKSNTDKTLCSYKKSQFFTNSTFMDKEVYLSVNGDKVPLFVTIGKDGDINLKYPIIKVEAYGKFHSTFNLIINYSGGGEACKLWTYNYTNFVTLLNELGYSISVQQRRDIIADYKKLLKEASGDCNKLDVLYENIPDFVAEAIDDNEMLFEHLRSLKDCVVANTSWIAGSNFDTDEQKAILNIFKCFDKDWLYNKIIVESTLFEDILYKLDVESAYKCLSILTEIAVNKWSDSQQRNAKYVLCSGVLDQGAIYNMFAAYDMAYTALNATHTTAVWSSERGKFEFGIYYSNALVLVADELTVSDYNSFVVNKIVCDNALSVVLVDVDDKLFRVPAIFAKYSLEKRLEQNINDFISLNVGLLLPEVYINANKSDLIRKLFNVKKGLYKGGDLFNGTRKIAVASADDIAKAAARIKQHRISKPNGGNYGYLEGIVNGKTVDNTMWRSTSTAIAQREIHIFDAIEVAGVSGNKWLRITDSEYRMLNNLAKDLGAVKGGKFPNVKGKLKIVSENPYCESCQGVIRQFNDMFPNVELILINGVK